MDCAEIETPSSQVSSALALHPLGGIPPEIWEKVLFFLGNDAKSLLLPCRQVCRNWLRSVDRKLQRPGYLHPDPENYFGVPAYTWYDNTPGSTISKFSDVHKLAKDIAISADQGRSLFFHKTVKLISISRSLTNVDEVQSLFQNFTQFISQHGHLIHSCIYETYGCHPESEPQLQTLFTFLPNLHSLAIVKSTARQEWRLNDHMGLGWLYPQREILPPLPYLKSLNVFLNDSPKISEMLLISYGHQLESFHCDFKVIRSCPYLVNGPVPKFALRNLKELSVFDWFGDSQFLEGLLKFELPNLETLSLNYAEHGPRHGRSLLAILKILDGFKDTLKQVRLPNNLFDAEIEYFTGKSKPFMDEVKNSSNVKLSAMKTLGLNVNILKWSLISLFLRKFSNLDTIWVTKYTVTDGYNNEEIVNKIRTAVEPFWEMVPSLRKISVDRCFVTTKTFNFYRNEV